MSTRGKRAFLLAAARERLVEICNRRLDLAEKAVLQNRNGLLQGTRKHLEIQGQRFRTYMLRLETALEATVAGRIARISERVVQLQERVRSTTSLAEQGLQESDRRLQLAVLRRLDHAQETSRQNLNGLIEGTRKHLAWKEEQFRRWGVTLQRALDKAFSHRLGALTTKRVLLEERLRARHDGAAQDLGLRLSNLSALCTRIVAGRLQTLALKTNRFNLAHFDRLLDRAVKGLEEKGKRLSALSPEHLLARGYSITRNETGMIIRSPSDVEVGQIIRTELAHGALISVLTEKETSDHE